jgi:hypothetical protein
MKRFHAHVRVEDLESSVRFYSTLFGTEPAVLKPDYAKWMLDDPRVNFAACCYAVGNKEWTADPSGISWETFYSFGANTVYGSHTTPHGSLTLASSGGCCPTDLPGSTCCGTPRAHE